MSRREIMKKIIIILLLCLALLPSEAHAQTLNVSSVDPATKTASPTARVNKSIISLVNRLKAMVLRLDKISQKIAARINKIYSTNVNSGETDKITKLTAQQKNITAQVKQLNADLIQLDFQVKSASVTGVSKKDYVLFRSQTMTLIGKIKEVYLLESDLISQMKKMATVTAIPKAKTVPLQ